MARMQFHSIALGGKDTFISSSKRITHFNTHGIYIVDYRERSLRTGNPSYAIIFARKLGKLYYKMWDVETSIWWYMQARELTERFKHLSSELR